jgi:hypothetical protein
MLVSSWGSAKSFADLKEGDAFSYELRVDTRHSTNALIGWCIGIKVVAGIESGAVAILLDGRGPEFVDASAFGGLICALPKLRFVLSPHPEDMSIGSGVNFDPGRVYLFGPDQEYLSFTYRSMRDPQGCDYLLNIETGKVKNYCNTQAPLPVVEVRRWALVMETLRKAITLFTYPADGEQLVF